ncbi:MAG: hypothetical protein R6W67_01100 [Bacteroidales bacterium]
MKTKTYIIGLITTMLVFLGVIFKFMHWPGAGIMLTIGIFMLLIIFLPLALRSSYRGEGSRENLSLYIITWFTCLLTFLSMLFKIMHWPGAGLLLMVAIPLPFVVFLPVYLYVTGKSENYNIYNTVAVLFLLVIFSSLTALLALNVSKERISDSLLLPQNYKHASIVISSLPEAEGTGPMSDKIDAAMSLLDEYEDMLLQNAGFDRTQWLADPHSLTYQLPILTLRSAYKSSELDDIHSSLESALNEIIALAGEGAVDKNLSGNIATILSMLKTPSGYIFADGDYGIIKLPWPLITLDGLRVNLSILKLTI